MLNLHFLTVSFIFHVPVTALLKISSADAKMNSMCVVLMEMRVIKEVDVGTITDNLNLCKNRQFNNPLFHNFFRKPHQIKHKELLLEC